jgi:hypothetical protein
MYNLTTDSANDQQARARFDIVIRTLAACTPIWSIARVAKGLLYHVLGDFEARSRAASPSLPSTTTSASAPVASTSLEASQQHEFTELLQNDGTANDPLCLWQNPPELYSDAAPYGLTNEPWFDLLASFGSMCVPSSLS